MRTRPPAPGSPTRSTGRAIGVDEWVAQRRGARERTGASRRLRLARLGRLAARRPAARLRRARRDAPALHRAGRPLLVTASSRCSTRCSPSASTSSSASRGCSTSATSPSSASAPTATRSSRRSHYGIHWQAELAIPRGRRGTALPRAPARAPVAAAARRLPRDRDALLRPGVRRLRQQREPDRLPVVGHVDLTGGAERDRRHRPARLLRLRAPRRSSSTTSSLLVVFVLADGRALLR